MNESRRLRALSLIGVTHTSPHTNSIQMKSQGQLCRANSQVHSAVVGTVTNKVNGLTPASSEGIMKQYSGDNLISERLLWWMKGFLPHRVSYFQCHPFNLPVFVTIISIGIRFLLQNP